jgi:hypothetical protein
VSEGTAHFSTLLLIEQLEGVRGRIDFCRRIEDAYNNGRRPDSERALVKTDASRDSDRVVIYEKTGFVLWMILNELGRDRMLDGVRDFFRTYQDNPDHPVFQDLLDVLRRHARDPAAYDALARQWCREVVLPAYRLTGVKKAKDGDGWVVTGRVENTGTGVMPVVIAATRGERFPKSGPADYREAHQTHMLATGHPADVRIRCDFEPTQLVVDPDANVLMSGRKQATAAL